MACPPVLLLILLMILKTIVQRQLTVLACCSPVYFHAINTINTVNYSAAPINGIGVLFPSVLLCVRPGTYWVFSSIIMLYVSYVIQPSWTHLVPGTRYIWLIMVVSGVGRAGESSVQQTAVLVPSPPVRWWWWWWWSALLNTAKNKKGRRCGYTLQTTPPPQRQALQSWHDHNHPARSLWRERFFMCTRH